MDRMTDGQKDRWTVIPIYPTYLTGWGWGGGYKMHNRHMHITRHTNTTHAHKHIHYTHRHTKVETQTDTHTLSALTLGKAVNCDPNSADCRITSDCCCCACKASAIFRASVSL